MSKKNKTKTSETSENLNADGVKPIELKNETTQKQLNSTPVESTHNLPIGSGQLESTPTPTPESNSTESVLDSLFSLNVDKVTQKQLRKNESFLEVSTRKVRTLLALFKGKGDSNALTIAYKGLVSELVGEFKPSNEELIQFKSIAEELASNPEKLRKSGEGSKAPRGQSGAVSCWVKGREGYVSTMEVAALFIADLWSRAIESGKFRDNVSEKHLIIDSRFTESHWLDLYDLTEKTQSGSRKEFRTKYFDFAVHSFASNLANNGELYANLVADIARELKCTSQVVQIERKTIDKPLNKNLSRVEFIRKIA